jgi:Ca-activated chloride channel homolog
MYMRKLGITRLRSRASLPIITGILLVLAGPGSFQVAFAQSTTTPPATQPPASTAQSTNTTSGKTGPSVSVVTSANQEPQTAPPAAQGPSTNPPPPWPAPEPPAPGGQTPAKDNDIYRFYAVGQEVILHATVADEKNRLVTDLVKDDFSVFENDQPQQIRLFRHEDIPVAMGILIDNSGSMREKRDEVNKAALNLVRSSNHDDQVFIVNFSDEPILDQDFTSDMRRLQAALEHVEARGGTALYDAVVAASDYLNKATLQRKVLFVVTDGEDDASQQSLEEAVQRVQQENGPTVYCIGLLGQEKNRKAKRALEILSQRTGGLAFFPPTLDQVDEISRSVAHDIRNQYTISYSPTTPKNVGGYRTIRVDAHARPYKKLSVRTRSGYYPGQESSMK